MFLYLIGDRDGGEMGRAEARRRVLIQLVDLSRKISQVDVESTLWVLSNE